jgi:hypothetical protein
MFTGFLLLFAFLILFLIKTLGEMNTLKQIWKMHLVFNNNRKYLIVLKFPHHYSEYSSPLFFNYLKIRF